MRREARKIQTQRTRRAYRTRSRISGTAERPRLSIFRSNAHMHAQIIDDSKGITVAFASTLLLKKEDRAKKTKTEEAIAIGKALAEDAKKKGVTTVVFDRGRYKYHGRVKAVAEAARESGLAF